MNEKLKLKSKQKYMYIFVGLCVRKTKIRRYKKPFKIKSTVMALFRSYYRLMCCAASVTTAGAPFPPSQTHSPR